MYRRYSIVNGRKADFYAHKDRHVDDFIFARAFAVAEALSEDDDRLCTTLRRDRGLAATVEIRRPGYMRRYLVELCPIRVTSVR